MFENTPVMYINFDWCIYDVLREDLVPFTIKGKLRKVLTFEEIKSKDDDNQNRIALFNNEQVIKR